jgi:hypothetical protein
MKVDVISSYNIKFLDGTDILDFKVSYGKARVLFIHSFQTSFFIFKYC